MKKNICPMHSKENIACSVCMKKIRDDMLLLQLEKIKETKIMMLDVIIAMSNKNENLYSFVSRLKDYKTILENE